MQVVVAMISSRSNRFRRWGNPIPGSNSSNSNPNFPRLNIFSIYTRFQYFVLRCDWFQCELKNAYSCFHFSRNWWSLITRLLFTHLACIAHAIKNWVNRIPNKKCMFEILWFIQKPTLKLRHTVTPTTVQRVSLNLVSETI
jgi:hypothetical protein